MIYFVSFFPALTFYTFSDILSYSPLFHSVSLAFIFLLSPSLFNRLFNSFILLFIYFILFFKFFSPIFFQSVFRLLYFLWLFRFLFFTPCYCLYFLLSFINSNIPSFIELYLLLSYSSLLLALVLFNSYYSIFPIFVFP